MARNTPTITSRRALAGGHFSKPPGRPAYTEVSLERRSAMIEEIVGGSLLGVRQPWINLVREHGMLEGTYRLLNTFFTTDPRYIPVGPAREILL